MILTNSVIIVSACFSYILFNADTSSIWTFFGRFHPLIVHLPIGFLFVVVTLEYLSTKKNFEQLKHATTFVLGMTALSSIIAALLGYFLSLEGGYEEDILLWHKWFGIALAAGSTIAWLFRYKLEQSGSRNLKLAYIFFLIVSFLLLIGTGHKGGSLTHGSDYLTSSMPEPLRKITGLPPKPVSAPIKITNIKEARVYDHIIQPILNERCTNCHGKSKKKGNLMLNNMDNILAGGENGRVLTPGKALKSKLYSSLLLPELDDRHMPPKGKVQLSKEQIRVIGWWIDQGASTDKKVAELKTPDSIHAALTKIAAGERKPEGIFAKKVKPADPEKLVELRKIGVRTAPIAAEVNYLQASIAPNLGAFGLKEAQILKQISPQLAWLNLSNKKIQPEALQLLTEFPNLSRLRLENTNVKDDMLKSVSQLKNLEYLNLYGTAITDSGLKHLASLKKLRHIYFWQTKVTLAEAGKLRAKIPSLTINMGSEIQRDTLLSTVN